MDNKQRIEKLKEEEYQELFGIRKPAFEAILAILERGGRPSRLSVLDKLVVTLGYYHDYRTMKNIAFDYDVSKSRISDAVKWVEDTLIADGRFALPSKRELAKADTQIVIAIVDATEQEIERPKKTAGKLFRQAKMSHHQRPNRDGRADETDHLRRRGEGLGSRLRVVQAQRYPPAGGHPFAW
jgi:predicted DNA-binding protein YlxM (UPF0122 family)